MTTALRWETSYVPGYLPDVIPLNDLREHEFGPDCWCRPRNDCECLVHNSMDGRELYERGERLVS